LGDGAIHLEELEIELLKDDNEASATTTAMPPSSTSSHGGHVPSSSGFGHGRPTMWEETPSRPRAFHKLDISCGKRPMQ